MTGPAYFANAKAFGHWLAANSASATELQVGFHKVGRGQPSMSWPDSVDEALCVGWIDGVRKRIDDTSYTIRFTPRKPGSIWSTINIAKVAKLEVEGRMTPAGTKAFALRTEARSNVYSHEQAQTAELSPAELGEFQRNGAAWVYFESTPPGYRKVLLHWITTAKKPETRAARLAKAIAASAAGQRLA